jgi:hypothetical protein
LGYRVLAAGAGDGYNVVRVRKRVELYSSSWVDIPVSERCDSNEVKSTMPQVRESAR